MADRMKDKAKNMKEDAKKEMHKMQGRLEQKKKDMQE